MSFWVLNRLLLVFVLSMALSCTFEQTDDTALEAERIDTWGDTIPPWGSLTIAFTTPLQDSSINYLISPNPGTIYNSNLNITKDTVIISVTGILSGFTEFTITPEKDLVAENGSILSMETASFSVITFPTENEPNDTSKLADTLQDLKYGILSNKLDADYYIIPDSSINEVYLVNHLKKCGMHIYNQNDSLIFSNESLSDTLKEVFSSITSWPLFIKVFSLIDSDSRYHLEAR